MREDVLVEIAHKARKSARETFAPRGTGTVGTIAAFILLLAFAAAAPLLYGLPPEYPRQAFGAGAMPHEGNGLLAFCGFLIAALTSLSGLPLSVRRLIVPLGSMVGLVLLALLQLTPLPGRVLSVIASTNLVIYHETAEILGMFRETPAPAPRVSVAPPKRSRPCSCCSPSPRCSCRRPICCRRGAGGACFWGSSSSRPWSTSSWRPSRKHRKAAAGSVSQPGPLRGLPGNRAGGRLRSPVGRGSQQPRPGPSRPGSRRQV